MKLSRSQEVHVVLKKGQLANEDVDVVVTPGLCLCICCSLCFCCALAVLAGCGTTEGRAL